MIIADCIWPTKNVTQMFLGTFNIESNEPNSLASFFFFSFFDHYWNFRLDSADIQS